jgi:glycine dehydrogenase subunit 1
MAVRAAVYLSLLGPHGLRRVAELCLGKAHYAAERLCALPGVKMRFAGAPFFKEFVVDMEAMTAAELRRRVLAQGVDPGLDLGRFDPSLHRSLLVAVTECRTRAQIDRLVELVGREVAP